MLSSNALQFENDFLEDYMKQLKVGDRAPDFSLPGADGETITLSEVYGKQNVVLVFNIGFA